MTYDEFQRHIGKAGISVKEFAQLIRVNRVSISDLELGRGTSRRAFVERVDRVVVFGGRTGGLNEINVVDNVAISPR